jgi:hypothetical protein
MTQQIVPDEAQGSILFPEYATLYDLVGGEVEGLTDVQLDFTSDNWAWAAWSIRRQLSHMANLIYGWLLVRWGDILFPQDYHSEGERKGWTTSGFDPRLDETQYWEVAVILHKLRDAMTLAQQVLADHTVGFLRQHTYLRDFPAHWHLMIQAHPNGVTPAEEPDKLVMTLEATFRHMYFEEITHLYNIQRLKRAQGLPTVVEVPRVGYWILDDWDRSEASSSFS